MQVRSVLKLMSYDSSTKCTYNRNCNILSICETFDISTESCNLAYSPGSLYIQNLPPKIKVFVTCQKSSNRTMFWSSNNAPFQTPTPPTSSKPPIPSLITPSYHCQTTKPETPPSKTPNSIPSSYSIPSFPCPHTPPHKSNPNPSALPFPPNASCRLETPFQIPLVRLKVVIPGNETSNVPR